MRHKPHYAATSALAAACLLLAATAPASAQPRPSAMDWPTLPNAAKSGSFAVVQIATANVDQFMAEWRKPTPGVKIHGTTQAHRGRPLATFIAFRGCRAGPAGKCNVTVTFSLRGPSGKIDNYPPMDVWAHQPKPAPQMIHISRQSLGMTFNASDPLGVYTLKAAVTDHVAGVTLHTQQDLTVSD